MKSPSTLIGPSFNTKNETRKWYKNPCKWTIIIVILIVLLLIIFTTVVLIKKQAKQDKSTHIHHTRIGTNVYEGGYELYRMKVLKNRNPDHQYKRLGDFIRRSLFNRTNYEKFLPDCPIILSMSATDHPDDWRGILFGAIKYPKKKYPYVCYISVMRDDRRHKLGSVLLNQFINEMANIKNPPVNHIQLHANWENCRAQMLYNRCGFRCDQFTTHGYPKPFEPEFKFGHMIRMELNMANIRDMKTVCRNATAVEISTEAEENYAKLCAIPKGINGTCVKKI